MYSNVFEITYAPVSVEKRVRAGNLPDWFYKQICDYAENTDSEQRQTTISQFCETLGDLCTLNGGKLTISPKIKETYFHKGYDCFLAATETLEQTDYETFSDRSVNLTLPLVLDKLNSSYEDKRGVYIYLSETEELITLDRWLRTADFSKPFYIGGAINYHY